MFGDRYYIKTPKQFFSDIRMYDSKHGWLLMHVQEGSLYVELGPPVFYNPFTSDICELPTVPFLESLSFSAPPTSPDCIVVGFTAYDDESREPNWRRIILKFNGDSPFHYSFPTFFDGDLYALCNDGELDVFKDIGNDYFSWDIVVGDAPTSRCTSEKQYFLVKCDQNLLLIIVGKFGESIELFELNDSTEEWEKIDGLGRHTIYICDTTCICIEANTPTDDV
ncbi:hypothetical protein Tco_1209434 [Tanacetum coccineum]